MAIEKDLGAVSAYAIAVENGFQGTVDEWLESLRYDHSDEFGVLAGQVQENAESAAASASAADQSKQAAAQSVAAAQSAANTSASKAGEASASASAAASSATQAAASAEGIEAQLGQAQAAAATATQKAGEAAQSADYAHDAVPEVTEDDNGKILTVVNGKWTAVEPTVNSWEKVQLIVRAGLAPQYFPVGYEFTTHDSTEDTDIVWRVVGFDTIKAANESLKHTMILETKYVYSNSSGNYISMQIDAPETLYYAETGLEAGTYNFTLLAGYDETYGGGKTYSFTLAKPVPAGGVIMFPWGYNQQASEVKISTYATQADTTAIETVPVTEGSEGTSLGTADGKTENMNHTHRIRYGSNNYAQSAIKQWLNSKEAAGSVWAPQTKFDRAPSWASNRTGFLAGLPEDFLSVVQAAIVPCRTNSIFEVDSLDGTEFAINQIYNLEEKFFLLSCPEIYGTWDNSDYKDGEQLDFYKGLTDAERIKYDPSGSARHVWLRSPYPDYAHAARAVYTSGVVGNYGANNANAAAPACIIA